MQFFGNAGNFFPTPNWKTNGMVGLSATALEKYEKVFSSCVENSVLDDVRFRNTGLEKHENIFQN